MNLQEYQAGQEALRPIAAGWTIELDLRKTEPGNSRGPGVTQAHLICSRDRQSVMTLAVDADRGSYVFTPEGLTLAVMRHFRECHCDGGGVPKDH